MYKRELPEGVPADNQAMEQGAGQRASFKASAEPGASRPGYTAPDMATPKFTQLPPANASLSSSQNLSDNGSADDGYVDQKPGAGKTAERPKSRRDQKAFVANTKLMMLMSLAAAIAIAGILTVATMRPGTPPCSTQPDWNQYNCRAG